MSLLIEYSDSPGLTIYAFLFSATDKTEAFNPSLKKFLSFTLSSQSDFVIQLDEAEERVGFYQSSIEDVSDITATTEANQFYLVEIYKATGSGFDRRTDKLMGTQSFFWDGEKEITAKELSDLIQEIDAAQGVLPNVQVPRFGPKGSSAGAGGISFSRTNGA